MNDSQIQVITSVAKVSLAFVNAFAGVLAAYPGSELPPLARLLSAALVAGCGGALLFLSPPGTAPESDDDIIRRADAVLRKRQAMHG